MHTLLLFVALYFSPILSSTVISDAFKTTQSGGFGTYYGVTTGGNCGYGSLYPSFASSLIKVALGPAMYQGNDGISGGCGVCISMQGTGTGSGANPISKTAFTVFAHDQCPECAKTSIDLSTSGDGKWGITWKAVACPVGSEKLKYKFQGSNTYYLKMQVVGHKLPLSKVEYVFGGKAYAATRSQDNYWVSNGIPTPVTFPITVNVYATSGEKVTDTVASLINDKLQNGGKGVQFAGTSGAVEDQSATTHMDSNTLVGIAVGCVVAAVLLVVIIVIFVRRRHTAVEEVA